MPSANFERSGEIIWNTALAGAMDGAGTERTSISSSTGRGFAVLPAPRRCWRTRRVSLLAFSMCPQAMEEGEDLIKNMTESHETMGRQDKKRSDVVENSTSLFQTIVDAVDRIAECNALNEMRTPLEHMQWARRWDQYCRNVADSACAPGAVYVGVG
jgi:hypothetical protein